MKNDILPLHKLLLFTTIILAFLVSFYNFLSPRFPTFCASHLNLWRIAMNKNLRAWNHLFSPIATFHQHFRRIFGDLVVLKFFHNFRCQIWWHFHHWNSRLILEFTKNICQIGWHFLQVHSQLNSRQSWCHFLHPNFRIFLQFTQIFAKISLVSCFGVIGKVMILLLPVKCWVGSSWMVF